MELIKGNNMKLRAETLIRLKKAIRHYNFPLHTYDFQKGKPVLHRTIEDLLTHIRKMLLSNNPFEVRDGLSNIIYWGMGRDGRRDMKVANFRHATIGWNFMECILLFQTITGSSLREIKKLGLPHFSNMSYVSKIRMILDPELYVVLDLKISKLRYSHTPTIISNIKQYPTYLPITLDNERVYQIFCSTCQVVAAAIGDDGFKASDIERGIFQLIDEGELELAANCLQIVMTEDLAA